MPWNKAFHSCTTYQVVIEPYSNLYPSNKRHSKSIAYCTKDARVWYAKVQSVMARNACFTTLAIY